MRFLFVILILAACPASAMKLDDTLSPLQNIDMQVDWQHKNRMDELSEEDKQKAQWGETRRKEAFLMTRLHSVLKNFFIQGVPLDQRSYYNSSTTQVYGQFYDWANHEHSRPSIIGRTEKVRGIQNSRFIILRIIGIKEKIFFSY